MLNNLLQRLLLKFPTLPLIVFLFLITACTSTAIQDAPPHEWVAHAPALGYEISLPQDWPELSRDAYTTIFRHSKRLGGTTVLTLPSNTHGDTVEDPVRFWESSAEDFEGFRILETYHIAPNVKRTIIRYDESPNGGCGATADILHILTERHAVHLVVEVCRGSEDKYDQEFVHQVFRDFTYAGVSVVQDVDLPVSPLWQPSSGSDTANLNPWFIGILTALLLGVGAAIIKKGRSLFRKPDSARGDS